VISSSQNLFPGVNFPSCASHVLEAIFCRHVVVTDYCIVLYHPRCSVMFWFWPGSYNHSHRTYCTSVIWIVASLSKCHVSDASPLAASLCTYLLAVGALVQRL
jgi:hypothetical protein